MTANILIVEDEMLLAKTLARKLEKLGYVVVGTVSSGVEAIQMATEKKPNLILMDIVIKGDMDGIETATKIKEKLNIPIIYTTAYDDEETLTRAEQTGSYGYVLKPVKERDLHAAIKMALRKHEEQLQIQRALEVVETMNEAKTRYLSIASHDLRTPLTAIQMSTNMLQTYRDKLTPEKREKHLERIQSAVTNMNQLLEDLLTLSQAEAGKLHFHPALSDIVIFCRQLLDDFQVIATDQHRLVFLCNQESFECKFDEKLLRYSLVNLLSNAIKYSPSGGEVTLNLQIQTHQLIITIQDQGIGIPEADQSKLFQQFERASNVGTIKGTGLGLCIVKQAIELHEGTIQVKSAVGEGTTFVISLPFSSNS